MGLGGAAVRRGERAAARPPVPAGQRPLAGAERHPLRPVLGLVAGDAAVAGGRRPRPDPEADGAGVQEPRHRRDAADLPGDRQRADRRVRAAGAGRVHARVRRAVRRPDHLPPARAAAGPLAAGRGLGRRPRGVVLDRRRQPGAEDRGGADRARGLRRGGGRRPAGRAARRPGHDAGHDRGADRPRAVGGAGVPRVRRDGDHPQPARARAPDPARPSRPVAAARRAARARRATRSRR